MSSSTLSGTGELAGCRGAESGSRALYLLAADAECSLPGAEVVHALRGELVRLADDAEPGGLGDLRQAALDWAGAQTSQLHGLLERADGDPARHALIRRAALACAPLALRCGAWLQWMSAPGNADDPLVLRILSLYAADVGVGHPRAARGDACLELLGRLRLAEYAVPATRLALDPRIAERDFYVAALLLAMSRRPDDFRPEVMGADLCLRTVGLPPALAALRRAYPDLADWAGIDPSSSRQPGGSRLAVDVSAEIVAELSVSGEQHSRVLLGFRWALRALVRNGRGLRAELAAALDPAHDMAELLRLRAREGAVYHDGVQLAGRSLSQWLRESQSDPGGLLRVLAGSRLVKAGNADRSSLVNGLVSERGPMFRVFAPQDLAVIRRWINSLPQAGDGPGIPEEETPDGDQVPARLWAALRSGPVRGDREPQSLRQAYHLLQGRADTPALRRFARGYVLGWLARSRCGTAGGATGLPASWDGQGLRSWLLDQHDRHGREFEAGADLPVVSRKALVRSTVQLAPLTLIDGAWLQGFTDYEHAPSELGHFLFQTYWDELGNGQHRLNHPVIYRQVLAEMDVRLPPTGSREFAEWPGFQDSSFELPVYWLCIGRFPATFLPEVLGLNLAMELSGVGGSYRRARIALREHGFSTRFVDIHNTIDNVATGHSAWAADAIDTHLSAVAASAGRSEVEQSWQRIRTGYRSLSPPSGWRARRAFRRASQASWRTGAQEQQP